MFRFGEMDDIFGQMDRMMNNMMGNMNMMSGMNMFHDPFSSMVPFGMRQPGRSPFPAIPDMMSMMQHSTSSLSSNTPGTFVSSSFVSYSSDGVNPPQVVERTHMNRIGPGGVREERRTLRDSRMGIQKMSIGRHINDRGHVMERSKNHYTGDEEENNEYINIEEEEADQFNQEWSTRMANSGVHPSAHHYIQAPPRRPEPVLAITGPEENSSNPSSPSTVASTSSDSRSKKLRIKPTLMKKDKKSKKPYRKE